MFCAFHRCFRKARSLEARSPFPSPQLLPQGEALGPLAKVVAESMANTMGLRLSQWLRLKQRGILAAT